MSVNSTTGYRCKIQIRFMCDAEIALGTGKAELLAAIAQTGSIAAAGRKMGMSYRRAWLLVETMNQCFYQPLVVSTKGGKHGGGAQLTALGEQVLTLYQQMLTDIEQQTQIQQQQLLSLLKTTDAS